MKAKIRALALAAALAALSACQASLEDIAPKAEKRLPEKVIMAMKAKGMTRSSPIMVRIFKEEGKLEVWKQKDNGRYDIIADYDICKWSGKLGPKFREGDRQAPEGFYTVNPAQMNPDSKYYLAFNIGYPNAYDRVHGRTGSHLMVHGACSSAGCYSMTDEQVGEIYAFARDAFRGGQTAFQVQAFPFRMTADNMARYRGDSNFAFWQMLKEGYDHFEITKVPPKVDICNRRYVFNRIAEEGTAFSAASACPPTTQPENLSLAYSSFKASYMTAFTSALDKKNLAARSPSIAGPKEAALVSKWSKARARGERVSREPPSLSTAVVPDVAPVPVPKPEIVTAAPAEKPERVKAKAEKVEEAAATETAAAAEPAATETAVPEEKGVLGKIWDKRKRLKLFGD
ncbi:MAG: murein L,D-transpeptidase family protein [Rhizobiaceae bacterium]